MGVETGDGAEELVQGVQVKLVGEDLGDDLEEVFLSEDVAALDYLLQKWPKNARLVSPEVDQLTQANNVAAYK
jgi:hypothetical protein